MEQSRTQTCKNNITFSCGTTKVLYHIGYSYDHKSIVERSLIAKNSAIKKRKQTCFVTIVVPMNVPMLTPRVEENKPPIILITMKWRSVQNKYNILVRIAQHKGISILSIREQSAFFVYRHAKREFGENGQKMIHKARFFIEKDQIREEVCHFLFKRNPYVKKQIASNHQRIDRPILIFTPRMDQILDGVPKFQVEKDLREKSLRVSLVKYHRLQRKGV